MALMLRIISRRLLSTFTIKNAPLLKNALNPKVLVFQASNQYSNIMKLDPFSYDYAKENIIDVKENKKTLIRHENFNDFMYMTNKDEDFILVIEALKTCDLKEKYKVTDVMIKLLMRMNKTNLACQLLTNYYQKNSILFSHSFFDSIIRKLKSENEHSNVPKIFKLYLSVPSFNEKNYLHSINMLSSVLKSLLILGDEKVFDTMKELIEKLKKNVTYYHLTPSAILNVVLIALKKNQIEYAMNFVKDQKILKPESKSSYELIVDNLESILHSRLGALNESVSIIERIINTNVETPVLKKFYPLTLNTLRFELKKSNNKDLLAKFEKLEEQILKEKQINAIDLFEMSRYYYFNNTTLVKENQFLNLKKTKNESKAAPVKKPNPEFEPYYQRIKNEFKNDNYPNVVKEFQNFFKNHPKSLVDKNDLVYLTLSIYKSKMPIADIKALIKSIHFLGSSLIANTLTDLYISIFETKDYDYGLEFLINCDKNNYLKKNYETIYYNLMAIAYSSVKNPDKAFESVEIVLKTPLNMDRNFYIGKIFPLTYKSLELMVKVSQGKSKPIAFKKLNDIKNKIQKQKAYSDIDIRNLIEERISMLKNN